MFRDRGQFARALPPLTAIGPRSRNALRPPERTIITAHKQECLKTHTLGKGITFVAKVYISL